MYVCAKEFPDCLLWEKRKRKYRFGCGLGLVDKAGSRFGKRFPSIGTSRLGGPYQ